MTFSEVLESLKDNYLRQSPSKEVRFSRTGWNGKGQWITLQKPEENRKMTMTLPYICISIVGGKVAPWTASQIDLLAEDWREV